MTASESVVDYLTGERKPVDRVDVVRAIVSLGEHSGGAWPRLTDAEIGSAIDSLIASRVISVASDGLVLAERVQDQERNTEAVFERKKRRKPSVNDGQDLLF